MYKFSVPQTSDKVLFEAVLESSTTEIDNELRKGGNTNESELKVLFGIKNKVSVGEPYYENLMTMIFREKQEIPDDIIQMIKDFDFHFISLNCSFEPDKRCKLMWARFGVRLKAISRETNKELEIRPIAYDMFPDEITAEIKCSTEVNIDSQLKFDLDMLKTLANLGRSEHSQKEFLIYEPEIYASGLRTSNVAWTFNATTEKGLWGNKRNLLLIIKTPKNSRVKGTFLLSGEVDTENILKIPLKTRKDNIIETEYDLSR